MIVLDNASWHAFKKLKVPENVWLLHLPLYSPQLNSAENLFQYFDKNFIANRVFETTDILKEPVLDGFNKLAKSANRIKSVGKRPWASLTTQNETSDENKVYSDGCKVTGTGTSPIHILMNESGADHLVAIGSVADNLFELYIARNAGALGSRTA